MAQDDPVAINDTVALRTPVRSCAYTLMLRRQAAGEVSSSYTYTGELLLAATTAAAAAAAYSQMLSAASQLADTVCGTMWMKPPLWMKPPKQQNTVYTVHRGYVATGWMHTNK